MTPLRVAMISFHTCPLASQEGKESGGMNVYVLELSKALSAMGLSVDMYTRCQDPSNQEVIEVSDNLRLIHLPAGPAGPYHKSQLLSVTDEFVAAYQEFTRRQNLAYDVLHCHYYLSGVIGHKINATLKVKLPIVFTYHTLALMKNLVARNTQEQENADRVEAELSLATSVDAIISPSENEREYLEYLYAAPAEKISVVPPGVDLKLFHPMSKKLAKQKVGADQDHKIILFAGRIEAIKGIDVLMYATKIFLAKNPQIGPVCVWIVGGDISQPKHLWSQELQRLEQLRAQLGLSLYVHFAGQSRQEELPYFYNAAEVVVMPSHYESFGMAAAEAMACGIPVITTNVTGISRLIDDKHQHLITSANNPLLLAKQIEHVLLEPDHHKSQELRQTVSDLDWSVVATNIRVVYERVKR